jgi:hypothetical protein
LAHVAESLRLRIVDQQSEDAPAAREIADRSVAVLIDAACQEALELAPAVIENAERRITGASYLAGRLEQLVEHGLQVQLRDERPPDVDQAVKAVLA